ncbi:MAG: flagellar hook-length control protein FliK, partial [Pseudomonadota bacterium]
TTPEPARSAEATAEAAQAGEPERDGRDPKAGDAATGFGQLLPGWNPTPEADHALPQTRGAGRDLADTEPAGAKAGMRLAGPTGSAQALATRDAQAAANPAGRAADAGFTAALQAAQAAQPQESASKAMPEPATQPGTPHDAPPPLAAAAAAAPGPASTAAPASPAAAAPFQAHLSAAPGTPEFAPALGVQVSILAREGVQEARLHLNPAELGPIAVQISLDGSLAQVHFQAEASATREALQAGLPELASALRDSGFTLSGGGVSDPRRDSTREQGGDGGTGVAGRRMTRDTEAAPGAEPATARALRRQGVVDLYA